MHSAPYCIKKERGGNEKKKKAAGTHDKHERTQLEQGNCAKMLINAPLWIGGFIASREDYAMKRSPYHGRAVLSFILERFLFASLSSPTGSS